MGGLQLDESLHAFDKLKAKERTETTNNIYGWSESRHFEAENGKLQIPDGDERPTTFNPNAILSVHKLKVQAKNKECQHKHVSTMENKTNDQPQNLRLQELALIIA